MYHRFEPEVAGGLGPGIDYDPRRGAEPLVGPLHYQFAGWLGDDIVTTSGYWIVTGRLADALRESPLTGYELGEVVVTTDEQFDMFYSHLGLPRDWERLIPTGTVEGGEDFVLETVVDLLVSDAALELLGRFGIDDADISPADEEPEVSDVMRKFLDLQRAKDNETRRTVPNDAAVDLIGSLVEVAGLPGSVDGWESLAMILEFGEGFRSAYGYAYSPGDVITPVACKWASIEAAVNAYLGGYYRPGERLPVKILVQYDRTAGKHEVTFEDTDEERWAVKPRNFRQMREQLRPKFG
ncbi:hypothetical protein [Amycolatopsis sp. WAC 01375]|uniref:hypothetical protein n=1 Tax=Amycolatopsis sp. WAC 01375 TaxID=2203194 RepID=UPI000F76A39B|nr:hypothetical protein [Amycolatopsis sp. WAC 01375]